MGICDNSHGRIDKETQSPLLNIFKEIMTREKDDPEKKNLLNEPREEKKKRQYSGSRNKADRKSCESSGSEHRKRGSSYKISSTEQRAEFNNKARSQSMPYQTEKKDSWWFWHNTPPKKTEDSCSYVSCALKKIVSSEYACIGCLILLFTISIIVAFLVVFKNVPNIGGECKVLECKDCKESTTGAGPTTPRCKECKGVADSERLKRKIEMLSNKRLKKGFIGVNEFRKNDDKGYDDLLSGHVGIPGVAGIDFGPSLRELNSMEESEHRQSNDIDLSNVLDANNMDIQNSEKLRDFYKKLVQTDAKIESLKKINQDESYVEDVVEKSPERSRRSLKLYHCPKRYRVLRRRRSIYGKQHKVNETSVAKTKSGNKTRLKRFNNEAEEPTGFIIEKKKLLVQYKPSAAAAGKRRIPVKKCQHAPAGTHTHEKQMMHPFYKNTQRLDLLLDKFLNKNLPEIMSDPFGIDELFKHEKLNKPCKHPKPHKNVNIIGDEHLVDQIPTPKFNLKNIKDGKIIGSTTSDLFKMLRPESTTQYERDFYNHEVKMIGKQKKKIVTASPNDFEVLLSVSTIMNPEFPKMSKRPSVGYEGTKLPIIDRVPNLRRLLQLEAGADEENLGYDDFKEVLTDDMANHDEVEKSVDRKRRNNDQPEPLKFPKFNPPQSVHNPNWKGAMPLYPDEINSMLANKADFPKPTDELQDLLAAQRKGRDLSDIEYVEDYLANKYDRLVQQAQAYSDYGVLDGKKESRNEKDSPTADSTTNHKIKLSADENFNRAGLLGRLKRGRVPKFVTREADDIRKQGAFLSEIEVTTPGSLAQTGIHSNYLKVATQQPKLLSEGIRIEMIPTTKSREDLANNIETVMKIVSKHVKLKPKNVHDGKITGIYPHHIHSTLISTCPDMGLVYTTKSAELTTAKTTVFKTLDELESEKGLIFAMARGNRRLLSTGFESSGNFRDYKNPLGYRRGNTERNRDSIDKFVNKLHMNKNLHSADETALKNYIEGIRQMNINIFSTPSPFYDASRLASEAQNTISEESIPITDPEVGKYPVEFLKVNAELPNSEVTINKSLVKVDTGDSFFGKILLTVQDPKFGVQNFNLIFDVPLVMNFKEELMMMNDNINHPNVYNQFEIYNDSTVDPQVSDMDSYPDHGSEEFIQSEIIAKRLKRETTVTATWSDSTEAGEYTKKDSNVTENSSEPGAEVTIIPAVAYNSTNSTVSAAPAVTLTLVYNNRSASSTPTSKTGRYANATMPIGDNMTLSEFFGVIANWFRTLEYGKQDKPTRDRSGSGLTDMLLTINSNITNKSNVSSTDSAYPLYDSDMIENIGHRSRVLLSVEDNVTNVTEENQAVNSTNAAEVTAASTAAEGNVFNRTTSTTLTTDLRSNFTTTKNSPAIKTFPTIKKDNKTKVKAIVKRNADDSNLIFWNDIYDDEYGIQRDNMDNYMKDKLDDAERDKHLRKEKDFIKRSGRWVQNKIRNFAKNLKINPHSNDVPSVHTNSMETKERVPRSIGHNKNHGLVAPPHIYDRDDEQVGRKEKDDRDEIEEDYPDVDQKSLFAALSVDMKEVCKKAAKAVQQTRNMENVPDNIRTSEEARDESKQGSIANALMQQLVRLLTDLVDYQVQQKTCTKLPAELQTFLEWLTNSREEPEESYKQSELLFKSPNKEDEELIDDLRDRQEDISEFPDVLRLRNKQDSTADDKTRYQDNLHSVQDLLEQYDDMTDDEKSKMLGVRGYLEKQLAFLNQQLSAYDLYTFFEKRDMTRNKRDVYIMKRQSTKHRPRRRPHKFIKTFGKKHTRTTAGYHDEAQVTDIVINRKTIENKGTIDPASDKNVQPKMTKRNLKDVYYKAIAEAKKFSSAKIIHKKDESSRFETSTAMGHK